MLIEFLRFLRISKFTRICMENHASVARWQNYFSHTNASITSGGQCNRYFWDNKIFQKWTVFMFTESWSHDHCHTKGLSSLDPRFGSFMVGFLFKRVYRQVKKVLEIRLSHKSNDLSWLSISSAFLLLLSTSHHFLWQSISQIVPIDTEWWEVAVFAGGYYFYHNDCETSQYMYWITLHSWVYHLKYSLCLLVLPRENTGLHFIYRHVT